ncbi:MAG TPA: hypothetical protein VE915_00005, partial [Actinomycetota bacterium]|nr:hypothetical protein [Actinomycetota bacterium]
MSTLRRPFVIALFLTVTVAATGPAAAVVGHATIDPEFARKIARADAAINTDAFVHFSRDISYEQGIAVVTDAGLTPVIDLPSINAVYA